MKKYALIKNGEILYICDEKPTKQEYFSEEEMAEIFAQENERIAAMSTEELLNYSEHSNVKLPGIDYDLAIPFEFEGKPAYVDGKIVPDPEPNRIRKEEIVSMLAKLSDKRKGLEMLSESTEQVDSDIAALKSEYENLV